MTTRAANSDIIHTKKDFIYLYFFIDTLDRFMVYVYAFILDI